MPVCRGGLTRRSAWHLEGGSRSFKLAQLPVTVADCSGAQGFDKDSRLAVHPQGCQLVLPLMHYGADGSKDCRKFGFVFRVAQNVQSTAGDPKTSYLLRKQVGLRCTSRGRQLGGCKPA
jgi:hypothetical protein